MTCVIGLISGTSVDGIDTALVEITGTEDDLKVELLSGETYPYPTHLREQILEVCRGGSLSMAQLAELDDAIAIQFALCAQAIQKDGKGAALIGSHGQTVYHRPPLAPHLARDKGQEVRGENAHSSTSHLPLGYSLQLGRGETIAQITGIQTISNFRVADIAAGGEGAPLVSRVDAYLLASPTQHRCIQNIGGISNLTYLPPRQGNWLERICGWDTGPGNTLLDLAVHHFTHGSQTYDRDGAWARQGQICDELIQLWLEEDFFHIPPPKSTGRELFGWDYFQQCLVESHVYHLNPADLLATLTEFTVASILESYHRFLPQMPNEVLLCGGGSRNLYLKERLQARMESVRILTTDEVGVSGDFKEAIAFAVLAYWRNLGIPGNLPQVTGAKAALTLGNIHPPFL
ncbi:MAG TPA: anhydro-N-acetylmuramic acid kinase [Cyanobacteria bacterium UBA11149]|nr:anhydro-N-acetylmuramic acid kinase [Cyanobacteria bacterium UBA11367]HBE57451.1 anhydro-N-acetylmuramic acid kinase [Cyanobacteria bacterium UBA11366]HBK66070.1 anhydro-N-acetylmuramic acid kinase [Cyanobacteria bacterium UBA11166]HBR76782.1 anhydro-N-acetylmuramic acid kinase [Cyanobacteria bacterium UBA11159]HBS71527.1 anhydro-N-acetylmuramic acid kinase [Cyanobacteria bacterium UBA11153]HBW89449.1 anhydro-N-acetylmuramic acid kinase [Cyanobacteria bacterium UBA11149]HCA97368.1 anhydro-